MYPVPAGPSAHENEEISRFLYRILLDVLLLGYADTPHIHQTVSGVRAVEIDAAADSGDSEPVAVVPYPVNNA